MNLELVITEEHIPAILAFENAPSEDRPHIIDSLLDKHSGIVRESVGRTFSSLVDDLTNFDCDIAQYWNEDRRGYREMLREHYMKEFGKFEEEYKLNPSKWL